MTDRTRGLDDIVRVSLNETLAVLLELWLAEPEADLRRVPTPTGIGAYSISIQAYRGVQSLISFRKRLAGSPALAQLELLIQQRQPELLGFVTHPGSTMQVQDTFALLLGLCQFAAEQSLGDLSVAEATIRAVDALDTLLRSGTATHETLTVLNGLRLDDAIEPIDLGGDVQIRRLTPGEIAVLGSNDVLNPPRNDIAGRFVTAALVSTRQVPVTLSVSFENTTLDLSLHSHQKHLDNALAALHITRPGRVGTIASHVTVRPAVLPGMSGYRSTPTIVSPLAVMELPPEDVPIFVNIYRQLADGPRTEVQIAAMRLLDAEGRFSPIDSLLDSVIGLEVLLNPSDRDELSFRVALNYAFLGARATRRQRYEEIRRIQKTRNKVVHGGLSLQSRDAATIGEEAEAAKRCLRDALTKFLTDPTLRPQGPIDADFWLDRIVPPDNAEAEPTPEPYDDRGDLP